MDVVYTVRPGDDNEELRYSLRSLANIPHNKVWIVGYKPDWVTGVEYIPNVDGESKYKRSGRNIYKACSNPDVSDDFILMNDDIFIMNPVNELKTFNRGLIDRVLPSYSGLGGPYYYSMVNTKLYLERRGFGQVISYELHIPMVLNKKKYLDMIHTKESEGVLHVQVRTLYGNLYNIGGEEMRDVKIYNNYRKYDNWDFVSTLDESFNNDTDIRRTIISRFPEKSKYEK